MLYFFIDSYLNMNTKSDFESSSFNVTTENSGEFIDDYSHVVKLSYFQQYNQQNDLTFNISRFTEKDSFVLSEENECDDDVETEETTFDKYVKKMRENFMSSKIPLLPHPSVTVASMISTASSKMGASFRHEDCVQPYRKSNLLNDKNITFSVTPTRRSTMKFEK